MLPTTSSDGWKHEAIGHGGEERRGGRGGTRVSQGAGRGRVEATRRSDRWRGGAKAARDDRETARTGEDEGARPRREGFRPCAPRTRGPARTTAAASGAAARARPRGGEGEGGGGRRRGVRGGTHPAAWRRRASCSPRARLDDPVHRGRRCARRHGSAPPWLPRERQRRVRRVPARELRHEVVERDVDARVPVAPHRAARAGVADARASECGRGGGRRRADALEGRRRTTRRRAGDRARVRVGIGPPVFDRGTPAFALIGFGDSCPRCSLARSRRRAPRRAHPRAAPPPSDSMPSSPPRARLRARRVRACSAPRRAPAAGDGPPPRAAVPCRAASASSSPPGGPRGVRLGRWRSSRTAPRRHPTIAVALSLGAILYSSAVLKGFAALLGARRRPPAHPRQGRTTAVSLPERLRDGPRITSGPLRARGREVQRVPEQVQGGAWHVQAGADGEGV